MICNCGGSTEATHKVVRGKELQGEYQKCPSCGRILWLRKTEMLTSEIKSEHNEYFRTAINHQELLIF